MRERTYKEYTACLEGEALLLSDAICSLRK